MASAQIHLRIQIELLVIGAVLRGNFADVATFIEAAPLKGNRKSLQPRAGSLSGVMQEWWTNRFHR